MKPSNRVKELCSEVCRANGKPNPTVLEKMDALPLATMMYLDEQAERLEALEALAKPLRYVIAPKHTSAADFERLGELAQKQGATVLPYGCELSGPTVQVRIPIPCSHHLPPCERRVLFFVPRHEKAERRWRVGMYVSPPLYRYAEWKDEESTVGDEGIVWTLEQVTHWMPLPGEPA